MTEMREFNDTQLLNSYGYIFVVNNGLSFSIGFMRRMQPEIHHGDDFPWVMATVGGMRDPLKVLEPDTGPNAEGFMGRPPTGDEVAAEQARLKLGILVEDTAFFLQRGWEEITHPFYYGNKTPHIRNVGSVFRKIRFISMDDAALIHEALSLRNATVKPEHAHEVHFLNAEDFKSQLLCPDSNNSMKTGEIDFLVGLYYALQESGLSYGSTLFPTAKCQIAV